MSNEPENKIDLKDMKLLLDEHYEKAGVPQETGDCKTDYLTALDLLNQGDHMGRWMMERLALRSYRPAMALMTILMAAENGSTGGLMALGQIYEKGGVLAQDLEQEGDGSGSSTVVTIGGGSAGEVVVPLQTLAPDFRGALVVCPGGNDPQVKLRLLEAVSALTGLSSHRISVCEGNP